MKIDRVEGVANGIVKSAAGGVVVNRNHRFADNAVAFAEAGLGLHMHQAFFLFADSFQNILAALEVCCCYRTRIRRICAVNI